tara:strand:- start:3247 stop:3942 length:696 start_codon:yes stop_codon:yes gene_type:complete
MTVNTINIGNIANDGTGDDLREAFIKVNNNFLELDARNPEQTTASNAFADASGTAGVFKEKDGFNLKFKNITAGNSNITITTDDNQIFISSSGIVSVQYTADSGVVNPLGASDLFKFAGSGGTTTALGVQNNVKQLTIDSRLSNESNPTLNGTLNANNNAITGLSTIQVSNIDSLIYGQDIRDQDSLIGFNFGSFNAGITNWIEYFESINPVNLGTITAPGTINIDLGSIA